MHERNLKMNSPFVFGIKMPLKRRLRRRLILTVSAAALLSALAWGLITVYVNSYNILHEEPMTVFGIYETSDGTSFVFLNRIIPALNSKK